MEGQPDIHVVILITPLILYALSITSSHDHCLKAFNFPPLPFNINQTVLKVYGNTTKEFDTCY